MIEGEKLVSALF